MRTLVLIVAVVSSRLASGQDAGRPQFEVASIRPGVVVKGQVAVALSGAGIHSENPEHFVAHFVALWGLVLYAYGLERYQLVNLGSMDTRWDIVANAAPGTTKEQVNLMLQRLLEERFHLTFHRETKEFKGYNLVIAKGGLKLTNPGPADGCPADAASFLACGVPGRPGIWKTAAHVPGGTTASPRGDLFGRNDDMHGLARTISFLLMDTPVIDRTGLAGKYDVFLQPSAGDPGTGLNPDQDSPLPAFFDALQDQLGLKLEPSKVALEVMVVDHIDPMPTEN